MKKEEKYYQIYRIHLLNGEVIEASEEYDLPVEKGLVGKFQKADDNKIFEKGDQIQIPGENLEYCHECEGIHGAGLQQKVKMGSHGGGCGRLTAVVS